MIDPVTPPRPAPPPRRGRRTTGRPPRSGPRRVFRRSGSSLPRRIREPIAATRRPRPRRRSSRTAAARRHRSSRPRTGSPSRRPTARCRGRRVRPGPFPLLRGPHLQGDDGPASAEALRPVTREGRCLRRGRGRRDGEVASLPRDPDKPTAGPALRVMFDPVDPAPARGVPVEADRGRRRRTRLPGAVPERRRARGQPGLDQFHPVEGEEDGLLQIEAETQFRARANHRGTPFPTQRRVVEGSRDRFALVHDRT